MSGGLFEPDDLDDGGAAGEGPSDDGQGPAGAETVDGRCAQYRLTDLGNADRLLARHGEDLLYIKEVGWAAWDGRRWSLAEGAERARVMAQKTARAIYDEALAFGRASDERKRHMKHADASSMSGAISNMLKEAQPGLSVTPADVDPPAAKHLINCRSGTLELGRAVRLRAPRRADRVTRLADVAWDPDAACPVFQEFLATIQPDPDMRVFLQTYFGYSITGETAEQVMVCLQGNGSNGKTTMLNCITAAIGDYHGILPVESLMEEKFRSSSGPSPDIARLPGTRLVTATEPEKSAALSEGKVKLYTGGEEVPTRKLGKDFFDFKPQFSITLTYNDPPRVSGTDDGIWRRILVVPFAQKVGKDEVGPLMAALDDELPGIFAWLIEGARLWFERGLVVPAAVQTATRDYRSDSDPIGAFLDETTVKVGRDGWHRSGAVYEKYVEWCKLSDLEPQSHTKVGRVLKSRCKTYKAGAQFYGQFRFTDAFLAALEGSGAAAADPRPEPPPAEPIE